jgi:hypothetical protein
MGILVQEGQSMCQQWFSVVGLLFDIVGFLLIAFEWQQVFWREHETRIDDLGHDRERSKAERIGETYEDPRSSDYTKSKKFHRLFLKEWRFRRKLFYYGVALVVLGFAGQTIGAWPHGLVFSFFRSC